MTTRHGAATSLQTRVPAPNSFVWGVSTSSFQIEGASHVDGRGDSIWDSHCRQKGRIKNGTAADNKPDDAGRVQDAARIAYLDAYTRAMQEAIRAGADVKGYFVWSLLDNFEWASGYSQRDGKSRRDGRAHGLQLSR
ncbi:hypothetical protein CVM73_31925 [Bradyrhizobium forestalis]|uniref:Glycosyl hydrolase family protein n=1 Tax=Bradyrhizobium forestalis TaxID=1419263 RepID=A0A2M8R085_9BRAD|nr:hypothetical protein CVM73_31925 [Bradyrhizobium forestalis]